MENGKPLPEFKADHATRFQAVKFAAILARTREVNAPGKGGRTALFLAAREGREAHVELLLKKGADSNRTDDTDEAPLQAAARYGHLRCAELLLDFGANIDHIPNFAKTEYSETALCSAIRRRHMAVVDLLLARGASVTAVSRQAHYPLIAAARNADAALCRRLIAGGAAPRALGRNGETALSAALHHGTLECVRVLLEGGADPNQLNCGSWRPLSAALMREDENCIPFIKELLRAGADVMLPNKDGSSVTDRADLHENAEAEALFRSLGGKSWDQSEEWSQTVDIGGGIEVGPIQIVDRREFPATEADRAMRERLRSRPCGLLASLGWEMSPAHLTILKRSGKPLMLRRMGYFCRGYFNAPEGHEFDDGPALLGETYQAAADRFVGFGFLRTLTTAEAVALNATTDDLKKSAHAHGVKLPSRKAEMVPAFVIALPTQAEEIARQQKWYVRTEVGSQRLAELGEFSPPQKVVRGLVDRFREATLETDVEKVLTIVLDLRSLVQEMHARYLHENAVTQTRRILTGEWPADIECGKPDKPKLLAVACAAHLLNSQVLKAMGCKPERSRFSGRSIYAIRWNFFGPVEPPYRRIEGEDETEPATIRDLVDGLTIEGCYPVDR